MSEIVIRDAVTKDRALKIVKALGMERPWLMTVEPYHSKRTNEQNRRLFKLHSLAAAKIGCSAAELHEDMLASHFGYFEVTLPSGVVKRVPLERSSNKDKAKFNAFMEFCETTYIQQLGVWLE